MPEAYARRSSRIIEKILKAASQEFGFFQVINHGVSENLMEDTMDLFKEFFDMPAEDKASVYSDDPSWSCRLYTSSYNYGNEEVHFWRDNLRHPCHLSEECMQLWPQKPTRYRPKRLSFETMENPSSSWFRVQSVPESYVFPPESRPGKLIVPLCKAIPVIDLGKSVGQDQSHIIHQILEASENFGIFQVINHGVSENLIVDTMRIFKEFYGMTVEDKESVVDKSGLIYTSSTGYAKDGVHLWRENLKQSCHPLEKCMQFSPEKPTRYREVVATYLVEVRELSLRILELICRGLGLEPGFFKESSQLQLMSVNYYPPCPDPSLTLGILEHRDPSIITILLQEVPGLQVVKDGQWIGVEALPSAFVVNIGNQLQIISNGKLRSPEHRAVTNSRDERTTITTFINPSSNCIVEPAKALVNASISPKYSGFLYRDFVASINAFGPETEAILKQLGSDSEP